MGVKVVKRHEKNYKDKIYIIAVFKGLMLTLRHFLGNLKTGKYIQSESYPETKPKDITPRYRGVHRLTKRQDDSVRCVACFMCATACPANCIFITAKQREDKVDEKMPEVFNIDLLECVFCGGCVEACPCDAIRMDTGIFSFIAQRREDFVLDINKLLSNKEKHE